jgi:hypothetical protein
MWIEVLWIKVSLYIRVFYIEYYALGLFTKDILQNLYEGGPTPFPYIDVFLSLSSLLSYKYKLLYFSPRNTSFVNAPLRPVAGREFSFCLLLNNI